MNNASFFVEKREVAHILARHGQLAESKVERDQGMGVACFEQDRLSYRWRAFAPHKARLAELPGDIRPQARALLSQEYLSAGTPDGYAALVRKLAADLPGESRLDISLNEMDQRILCADSTKCITDRRRFARLRLQVFVQQGNETQSVLRTHDYSSRQQLESDLPARGEAIGGMIAIAREKFASKPCPTGNTVVVLAPGGSPAQFFHEICGHPLEGDMVSHGTTYLGPLLGQRVAEQYVTVLDDPTCSHALAPYLLDDEGVPAQAVALIREGIVGDPLLDTYNARLLGRSSNGHGRRLNFRYYALPRLSHVELQPHAGTLETLLADLPRGVLILDMSLRHMNMTNGDFSFYVREAREIRNGKPGALLAPGLLRGNALEAMSAIDAVGADPRPGGGGCGKLDQGPLYVSYSQPTVRFKRLWIEPGV